MNSYEEVPIKKISLEVKSISCHENVPVTLEWEKEFCYQVNENSEQAFTVIVKRPFVKDDFDIPLVHSNKIIAEGIYSYGFKLVQLANKEYGYICEKTKELLPFRYDVASNFNAYGLAMVGKNGSVSWINQDFQYLTSNGEIKKEDNISFDGFYQVRDFSEGKSPLAIAVKKYTKNAFYVDTTGKIKNFYLFTGSNFDFYRPFIAFKGKDFGNKDCIIEEEGLLFSTGYYVPTSVMLSFYAKNVDDENFYFQLEQFRKAEKVKIKK